ncbi:hypothetical protein L6452_42547 [Arctium lappa]|uniref:Uncharacterized protein n=1 Tax=Arctium lappa TaxID=4217 RepID=A0ACB8XJ86_ARCLA|nr:hypothetical protein L6452_42547 [Arctium lappa]
MIRNHNSSVKLCVKFAAVGVIQPLVLLLFSGHHDAHEASLFALLNRASRSDRNKEQIVTCGAIPPLVKLLRCLLPSHHHQQTAHHRRQKPLLIPPQVNLAHNSFTGVEILKPINNNLITVDLGFNRIVRYPPTNFSTYPMLASLTLSYNKFRGRIPWEYNKKATLNILFLDGNYLIGLPAKEFFSGKTSISGNFGDNCLKNYPVSSELCLKSQKPWSICQQAYRRKLKPNSKNLGISHSENRSQSPVLLSPDCCCHSGIPSMANSRIPTTYLSQSLLLPMKP